MKCIILVSTSELFEKMTIEVFSPIVKVITISNFSTLNKEVLNNCIGIIIDVSSTKLLQMDLLAIEQQNVYVVLCKSTNQLLNLSNSFIGQLSGYKEEHEQVVKLSGGNIIIDLLNNQIINDKKSYYITQTENKLLRYLLENKNTVCCTESILANVWGDDNFSTSSTVYVYIRKLREKIEGDPSNPEYIITHYGYGYELQWYDINNNYERSQADESSVYEFI
nr:winged helix-turn-helix domain-containing protein [Evansella halocellulosilytica]